jgi:hypothetical protein
MSIVVRRAGTYEAERCADAARPIWEEESMQLDAEKFLACVMVTGLITAAGCGRSERRTASARQTNTGGETAAAATPANEEVEQQQMDYGTEPEPSYGAPSEGYEETPPSRNLPESGLNQEEPAPVTE